MNSCLFFIPISQQQTNHRHFNLKQCLSYLKKKPSKKPPPFIASYLSLYSIPLQYSWFSLSQNLSGYAMPVLHDFLLMPYSLHSKSLTLHAIQSWFLSLVCLNLMSLVFPQSVFNPRIFVILPIQSLYVKYIAQCAILHVGDQSLLS